VEVEGTDVAKQTRLVDSAINLDRRRHPVWRRCRRPVVDADGRRGDSSCVTEHEVAVGATYQSAERALALLASFDDSRAEIGVSEMAETLGVHKSTASRLAAALERAGADLAAAESDVRRGTASAATELTAWLAGEAGWAPRVISAAPRSLYDPARLAQAGR